MEKIGLYPFVVQPYQVDFQQKITLMGLGYYLFEAAGMHADQRGFGLRDLMKQKKAWFLSRLAIRMDHYPRQYENIWLETWIVEVDDHFTTRSFHVLNEKREVIGGACSSWAMIDLKTRKPDLLKPILGEEHIEGEKPALVRSTEKVPPAGQAAGVSEHRVVYSDLDILGHVNSLRYIQWMLDLFPLSLFQEKQMSRLDINYIAETNFGEQMELRNEERAEGKEFLIEIAKKTGGSAPVCRGRVQWE